MSSTNLDGTMHEFNEAKCHIAALTAWLDSHPLSVMQAQQRLDRIRELKRWEFYLGRLGREVSVNRGNHSKKV